MKLIESLKSVFDLSKWTDRAFIDKQLPSLYYPDGSMGLPPLYDLIDPVRYRGGIEINITDGAYGAQNMIELFQCVPEIFAPIHAIASRIANADTQLRKWYDDEVIYNNKEWNRLYEKPNPLQSFRELIYEAVVYEYVTGNEYMFFNRPKTLGSDYKSVVAMWNLPAEKIEPVLYSSLKLFSATEITDLVKAYKLDENTSFEPEQVMHIKSINLNWNDKKLKGRSQLCSANKAISNLIAVYEARNVIYTKRGALGFIVSRKSDASGNIPWTPTEKKAVRDEYNGTYGITQGKAPIGLIDVPSEYIKVGATISELEPFKETLVDAMAIYSTLGVPTELMPQEGGNKYENLQTAERNFYQNVIIPKANMYYGRLTEALGMTEGRLYLHPSFDNVEALQENKKEKADVEKIRTETAKIRFMSGVITLNDWVIDAGFEEQGNQLYDKRIFDMTPEEQTLVMSIMKATPANNQNTNNDANQGQQQSNNTSGANN